MKKKNLIIKLGAAGDVARTTPLLRALEGDIYWVSLRDNFPLIPSSRLAALLDIGEAKKKLHQVRFDLVLCLDDEIEAAALVTSIEKEKLVGSYLGDDGNVTYTPSGWFDMGLISRFGKERADELKIRNTKTYQELMFEMAGREFNSEEYLLDHPPSEKKTGRIGIETRVGKIWPTKKWNQYENLGKALQEKGHPVYFFDDRTNKEEYIAEINECDLVVTGDSLALHIALALKKKVVCLFTCTSPTEIYGYGRLIKIVSPELNQAYYSREYVPAAVEAISLEEVLKAVTSLI